MVRSSTSFTTGNTASVGNKSHTGQYTVWRVDLCDKLLPLARQGWSVEEICDELEIGVTTWYEWIEQHPEWAKAVSRAKEAAYAWWQRFGRENLMFDSDSRMAEKTYGLHMMNRFGWNKKEETTVKGELADALKTLYDRLNPPKS